MQYDAGQLGTLSAYERGGYALFFQAATGAVAQVGNALPVAAVGYGMAPTNSNDQVSPLCAVQIDATGTLAGSLNILCSLDGVSFYVFKTIAVVAATGQLVVVSPFGTRFISASFTGPSGSGTITAGFAA